MFVLQISVESTEDAERILDTLREVALSGSASPVARDATRNTHPATRRPEQPVSDDVRQAMSALQARYGLANMGVPLALLAQFGVDNIRQLRPEQHADFIAACAEA